MSKEDIQDIHLVSKKDMDSMPKLLPNLAMKPLASEVVNALQEALRDLIPSETFDDTAAPLHATRSALSDLLNTPANKVRPSERHGLVHAFAFALFRGSCDPERTPYTGDAGNHRLLQALDGHMD